MYRLEILDPNNYNLGVSNRAPGDADGLFGAVVEPLLAGGDGLGEDGRSGASGRYMANLQGPPEVDLAAVPGLAAV